MRYLDGGDYGGVVISVRLAKRRRARLEAGNAP
jgi:hypothetical protein